MTRNATTFDSRLVRAARLFGLASLGLLQATLAAAQSITTGAGAPSVIEIPVNHPAALGLLALALAAFASWVLLHRRGANGTPFLLVGILLLAVWGSPPLRAQVLSQFIDPAGETVPIPIVEIEENGVLQGFERADFENASGARLVILEIEEPGFDECFPLGLADPLAPPTPLGAGLCEVDALLHPGSTCSVDVDTLCKQLVASIEVSPGALLFAENSTGDLTVTNHAGSPVAADNVAAIIPGGSTISVQSTTCPAALVPGQSCGITLASSVQEGPTEITVQGANTNGVAVEVTVAAQPQITITGPVQQNRVIAVGSAIPLLLEVTNDAGSALTAVAITVTDKSAAPDVQVDDSNCAAVAAGASCTLELTSLSPYAPATITVGGSNTANSPQALIAFSHLGGLVFAESAGSGKLVIDVAEGFTSQWTTSFSGTTATSLDDGSANTSTIVADAACSGDTANCAAQRCRDVGADWYLPARNELSTVQAALCPGAVIPCDFGGFSSTFYWSSSELDGSSAWTVAFPSGTTSTSSKTFAQSVRCVRAF